MKFKSPIFTQVSGSIAGMTFARNKGGLYIRARTIPTNPSSPAQLSARNAMANVVDAWTNVLTTAQRDGWGIYAINTPVVDVFGDPKTLSGQQMYNRSNSPRVRQGEARVDDAPVLFDLGTFTTPVITVSAAAPNDVSVAFTILDTWATFVGGFLFGLVSRQQNPSINFFKGPFRSMGNIPGDDLGITSPVVLTSEFPYAEGGQVFAEFRAAQADGRLSNTQTVKTIVVA